MLLCSTDHLQIESKQLRFPQTKSSRFFGQEDFERREESSNFFWRPRAEKVPMARTKPEILIWNKLQQSNCCRLVTLNVWNNFVLLEIFEF